jgi:sugar phosphate isomerase/epimerase
MIKIGLSTSSVYPLGLDETFSLAASLGYDGVEVMVTRDKRTQDADQLRHLEELYGVDVLSIHAPVLLLTHFVWGTNPRTKLAKSAELARDVGATTVVVHPPFRWQKDYATNFMRIVREISAEYGVTISVENMFPWKMSGKTLGAYLPGYDITEYDCDAVTLDFSHAALSGHDAMQLAKSVGSRLSHVHLCDGTGVHEDGKVFDEHLLPGKGGQPVAEVIDMLARTGWKGHIIAEVNTRKAKTERERVDMLRETLEFARTHTSVQQRGVWSRIKEALHGSRR